MHLSGVLWVSVVGAAQPNEDAWPVVDAVEGHCARMTAGAAHHPCLPLSTLPPGVREGDVVLDGERRADLTHRLHARVARARAGQVSLGGGFDLADAGPDAEHRSPPLSAPGSRR